MGRNMGKITWHEALIVYHLEKSLQKQSEVFTLMVAGFTCKLAVESKRVTLPGNRQPFRAFSVPSGVWQIYHNVAENK